MLNKAITKHEETSQMYLEYWKLYSHMGTWQFWVIFVCLFALPLIVLYFTIDREKIFLIGFYGFNINVWLTFVANIGTGIGWWDYPYMLIPIISTGFSVNSAFVPVLFMLVYQWTLNNKKNFYFYSLLTAIILTFVLDPLLVSFDFLTFSKEFNYFLLLLIYTSIFLFSKLITSIFVYMQKTKNKQPSA
ncbi:hypothetical protein CFK37_08515 [Virgibacillus phasianinus]|uniref:Uncharacterized protein n=2 Tax=Virgibacillus phasianinus TaxID=2017483 RepID=A0A220U9B6_9BACI|nr:hypothetical protein CFK37_08515 [Virgibacillus phasianinus]